jgi:hypothetical protein
VTLEQLRALAAEEKLHGLVPEIRNEDYHAGPGISSSNVILAGGQSPAHFKAAKANPKEPTPALIMGNAIHVAVLEPELLDDYVTFVPDDCKGNSGAAKAAKKDFLEESAGKYILPSEEDFDRVRRIADSVYAHGPASRLLTGGKPESSGYWKDPETGLLMKLRSDYLRVDDGISVNLKSATDASEREFQRSVAQYKYHWQTGIYCDGLQVITGREFTEVHLVVEKEPPFAIGLYVLDYATLEKAREQYRPVINRLSECESSGIWPGYSEEVQTMNLPAWAW